MLRGINVGGKKILMTDLRDLFTGLGYENVATYIQSGNVVFSAATPEAETRARLEGAIAGTLGLDVAVLVRTVEEMRAIAGSNPFLAAGDDPASLHVTFLAESPHVSSVDAPPGGHDEFRIAGREVYLACPDGYGRTKLNNSFWERRLKMPATTRNWRTVMTLLEMADQ